MPFIARADEDRGDLFAWWDGSELDAETQFACNADEVVLVLDAQSEDVVATLGPGRHSLPVTLGRYLSGGKVLVIFVTTAPVTIEAEGVLDAHDDQPWVELAGVVTVRDPVKALELLPHLDDDETPEDWVAEELVLYTGRAVEEDGGDLEALSAKTAMLSERAQAFANEDFAGFGLSVALRDLELSESEEE